MAYLVPVAAFAALLLSGVALFLVYQLIGQNGRILLQLDELNRRLQEAPAETPAPVPPPEVPEGLPLGSPAPAFELPDLWSHSRSLAEFRGRPVLLVFFSPRCGYCLDMLTGLAALPWEHHGSSLAPVLVTSGTVEENQKLVKEYGLRSPVLLQKGGEVAGAYEAYGTPIGYLIDAEGRIASEMTVGADALLALARQHSSAAKTNGKGQRGNKPLSESKIARDGLPKGTVAPTFRVPTVAGPELALEDYRGERLLLVFSDPDCGPCQALAPELERIHRRGGSTRIVMVSRGTVEENLPKVEEFGPTFPVGLQKRWEISQQYAMFGAPIAYLIDGEGRIAEDVAVGMESILRLLEESLAESAAGASVRKEAVGAKS